MMGRKLGPSSELLVRKAIDAHARAERASHRPSSQGSLSGSSCRLTTPRLVVKVERVLSYSNRHHANLLALSALRH